MVGIAHDDGSGETCHSGQATAVGRFGGPRRRERIRSSTEATLQGNWRPDGIA
jgi:hypothetical protein